jgi:hypothetical protein
MLSVIMLSVVALLRHGTLGVLLVGNGDVTGNDVGRLGHHPEDEEVVHLVRLYFRLGSSEKGRSD